MFSTQRFSHGHHSPLLLLLANYHHCEDHTTTVITQTARYPMELSGQWCPHKIFHSSALRLRPRATEQCQARDRGEGAEGDEGEGGNCNVSKELELDL